EYTHRRRMTGHTGRNRGLRDAHSVAVERDFLRADIDGNLERAFRHLAEAWMIRLRLGPLSMAVRGHPDAAMGETAIPAASEGGVAEPAKIGVGRACQSGKESHGHARNQRRAQDHQADPIGCGDSSHDVRQVTLHWLHLPLPAWSPAARR